MFTFITCSHQFISSSSIPLTDARPNRARRKKRKSTRGKQATGFTHFIEATALIRSVIKNLFLICLISLGIYGLISLPAFLSQNDGIASSTAPTVLPSEATVTAQEDPQIDLDTTVQTIEEQPEKLGTNENPNELISENIKSTDPVGTPAPNTILTISSYKATLFSELNGEEISQINLTRGAEIQPIKRIGDWLEVEILGTGATGFIHTSQTSSDQ